MYYKNTIITVCNFKKLKISQFATPSGSHKQSVNLASIQQVDRLPFFTPI